MGTGGTKGGRGEGVKGTGVGTWGTKRGRGEGKRSTTYC